MMEMMLCRVKWILKDGEGSGADSVVCKGDGRV